MAINSLNLNGFSLTGSSTLTVTSGIVMNSATTGTANIAAPLSFGTAEGILITNTGATTTINGSGSLSGSGGIAIDAQDLRALARKGHGGRLAVAPAGPDRTGADHDRCLALQASHAASPLFVVRKLAGGKLAVNCSIVGHERGVPAPEPRPTPLVEKPLHERGWLAAG